MLPSRVRRSVAARWGESIISPASICGPAGRGGDGGGRSAWWSASSGREDPCFVGVALHAALIDGRTYRVVSSDGAATNPVSGATTGWVLCPGRASHVHRYVRRRVHRRRHHHIRPRCGHHEPTRSSNAGSPGANAWGPHDMIGFSAPTGDGAVNVNSATASPVPVTDEFTPRLA
jgi:hypothetical protein